MRLRGALACLLIGSFSAAALGCGESSPSEPSTEQAQTATQLPATQGELAVQLVRRHYQQLNRGRFGDAWQNLSSQLQEESGGYHDWREGYAFTEGTYIERASATSEAAQTVSVEVEFNSDDLDACGNHVAQQFEGVWHTVIGASPSLADAEIVKTGGGDPIRDVGLCPAVVEPTPPTADYAEQYREELGDSYEPALDFCDTHECIPNFGNGRGYPVQCEDGTWSQSGGIQGACSWHGGVRG